MPHRTTNPFSAGLTERPMSSIFAIHPWNTPYCVRRRIFGWTPHLTMFNISKFVSLDGWLSVHKVREQQQIKSIIV